MNTMNTMCVAFLAALLLALQLSSQVVLAQTNATVSMNGTMSNSTTSNSTTSKPMMTTPKAGCESTAAFPLLLPVALAASLLLGWSH